MEKYIYYHVLDSSRDNDIQKFLALLDGYWESQTPKGWFDERAAKTYKAIFSQDLFPRTFTVFIERNYVDRMYRDIYYNHYSSRHFQQPRNCLRLFFFDGIHEVPDDQDFIGVSILQPNGIIGRSYWHPRVFLGNYHYVRTVEYDFTLLGSMLKLRSFPHSMQDQEATTCAEITALNLIDYYSQCYPEYSSALLSDIEKVEAQYSADRIFPSKGMSYADIARSLAQAGLSPKLYASRSLFIRKDSLLRYLYCYVESGIPFGIAVKSKVPGILHSIICIGHGSIDRDWPDESIVNYLSLEKDEGNTILTECWIANSADAYNSFIVMDDTEKPYEIAQFQTPKKPLVTSQDQNRGKIYTVEHLCVPLYRRVFMEVDVAEEIFLSVLTSKMGYRQTILRTCNNDEIKEHPHSACHRYKIHGGSEGHPLVMRMFLASSRTFLLKRIQTLDDQNSMSAEVTQIYQNLFCPRFIWVCELYSMNDFKEQTSKVIGEIVLDATTRHNGNVEGLGSVVLIHYPNYITYRDPDPDSHVFDLENNQRIIGDWEPFEQFDGNLTDFSR